MGLGPPARGVDMFRNTWRASVKTELSNALVARTYDLRETLSETRTSMLAFSANCSCIPPCGCASRRESPPQRSPGLILFCHCPQVVASMENKSKGSKLAEVGIHVMSDLPDL